VWSLGSDVWRVWSVGELGNCMQRVRFVGAWELGDGVQRVAVKLSVRNSQFGVLRRVISYDCHIQ